MPTSVPGDGSRSVTQTLQLMFLLWCAGAALRIPILGVPPLVPHI
jgi:hypothetical protein